MLTDCYHLSKSKSLRSMMHQQHLKLVRTLLVRKLIGLMGADVELELCERRHQRWSMFS